ncbi:hypothetical protein KGF57_002761 [Candida theae]|uniref:Uncharacterized protein n=1 Tax=Candida theae TaxID=1198502 RepID=A0AAD5BE42_9ASCO|nr:uncharacterized protein KGF57_002761 [Candida theae]KAI5957953.1 hypothetical protein KGF57_002761 [Candida theae]
MEGIENRYPENTAYQFLQPPFKSKHQNNSTTTLTKRSTAPLQETSTNILNNNNNNSHNNRSAMLRDSKSLASPIKTTAHGPLNFKKRVATSPTPTLISQNTKRKYVKPSSIKADDENVSPINPRHLKTSPNHKSKSINDTSALYAEQDKTAGETIEYQYPLWPPQSVAEAEIHRQLYLMEQKAKHFEELSHFLALEQKYQLEVKEIS